ncbi:MAG: hypothetical protein WCJ57_03505 [Candidatus Falkowbacteria bacterium]
MGFERSSFIPNAEEQSGIALEKELFGGINLSRYQELATDALVTEKLKAQGKSLTVEDIKKRNKEMYDDLKKGANLEYLRNTHNPILSKDEMFDIIKRSQVNQAPRPFIADMKKAFAERVGVEDEAVNFYSALGTNADYCGVDGIFSINIQGYNFDIAVDLTKKSEDEKNLDIHNKINRGGKYFGDVILSFSNHDDDYSRERDADLLPGFAEQLFEHLKFLVNKHNEQFAQQNN